MSHWYQIVLSDETKILEAMEYFEEEYLKGRDDVKIKGIIEKQIALMPSIVEHRYSQLQEIEAILKHMNIQLDAIHSKLYRKFSENYNKALTKTDIEKYLVGETEYINMAQLVNTFALVRNKFISLTKALESKQFQLSNITKLRVAGLEDHMIDWDM